MIASVLAVISLFAMVVAPSISLDSAGASPTHSHIFLTHEAAAHHSHSNEHDHGVESGVVNLGGHTADSASHTVHVHAGALSTDLVRLVTNEYAAAEEPLYSAPVTAVPGQPPRVS